MADTHRFVRSGDARICTQAFGAPQDPAIVLIMGATASMMWWPDRLCNSLAGAGYFVIRFDHRDTGGSTTSSAYAPDYDVENLAEDVIAVLDGYELARAHLVGMSLGALISQWVALAYPERVRTLTLIASEPLGGEALAPLEMSAAFLDHFGTIPDVDWDDREAVRTFLERLAELSSSPARGYDIGGTSERIERELVRATDIRASFNHAFMKGDLKHLDLRRIAVPTLVVHGAHDPIVPLSHGEAVARQINAATFCVLPEAGHELHGNDLEIIAAWIVAHTQRPRRAAASRRPVTRFRE